MNIDELKKKLYAYNVPERWYSLDEGLKPDACILTKNHSLWEFFYQDEKGDRSDFRIFINEEEAFDYLWKMMEKNLSIFNIPPKTDITL